MSPIVTLGTERNEVAWVNPQIRSFGNRLVVVHFFHDPNDSLC